MGVQLPLIMLPTFAVCIYLKLKAMFSRHFSLCLWTLKPDIWYSIQKLVWHTPKRNALSKITCVQLFRVVANSDFTVQNMPGECMMHPECKPKQSAMTGLQYNSSEKLLAEKFPTDSKQQMAHRNVSLTVAFNKHADAVSRTCTWLLLAKTPLVGSIMTSKLPHRPITSKASKW